MLGWRRLWLQIRAVGWKWRRSLTFRSLVTTMLLAMLVATGASAFLLSQIRDGLVQDRVDYAVKQSADGLRAGELVVSSLPVADSAAAQSAMVDAVVAAVAAPGGSLGDYEVLLLASRNERWIGLPERGTNDISDKTIGDEIRQALTDEQALVWQIGEVSFLDSQTTTGVVVGAPIYLPGVGNYELFQVFPFDRQLQVYSVAQSATFAAGVLMVVALAAVSLFMTNQVVRPVRRAAESAERLRSGRLTERLAVSGQDDLAVLASSFNSMAASMQDQITRLESLSRVQQRFVSDVSHELRTPLTTIRMAADLLHSARDGFDPASAKAAELLQQQSERFELLLTDLIEISRIDAGSVTLDPQPVDLTSISQDIIAELSQLAEANGVSVTVIAEGDSDPVLADARRMERIVRNLVSNALEHAQNSRVVVAIAGGPAVVSLCVRDYGIGLQPGEAALVFNRFWRADPSRERTIGGTGLGLSISLEDARLHGGWLEADGEPGRGANFRMVVPRQPDGVVVDVPLPLQIDEFDEWLASR